MRWGSDACGSASQFLRSTRCDAREHSITQLEKRIDYLPIPFYRRNLSVGIHPFARRRQTDVSAMRNSTRVHPRAQSIWRRCNRATARNSYAEGIAKRPRERFSAPNSQLYLVDSPRSQCEDAHVERGSSMGRSVVRDALSNQQKRTLRARSNSKSNPRFAETT
jgi:hypothetical protein